MENEFKRIRRILWLIYIGIMVSMLTYYLEIRSMTLHIEKKIDSIGYVQ